MKPSPFLIFLTAFLISHPARGQWLLKNVATNFTLSSVSFLNDAKGYVSGGNKIFKTNNGGDTWETSFTASNTTFLEEISIITSGKVVAVGRDVVQNKSVFVKTEDDGANWQSISMPSQSFLKSVFFVSPTLGFCSGSNGSILKTTDGGDHWQNVNSGTSQNLESIFFADQLNGIAVGGSPVDAVILKTQDGGNNWSPLSSPSNSNHQSVYFVNAQLGYIVGWNGEILKTEDGGNSWTQQNSVSMSGNLDVFFTDENTGYVVGGDLLETLIQKTENGGNSWTDISPNAMAGLTSICFSSDLTGYAVGYNGTVLKTSTGGVSKTKETLITEDQLAVYPNPLQEMLFVECKDSRIIDLIELYDNRGQLIRTFTGVTAVNALDLSSLESNNYYLIIHIEQDVICRKLVKI